MPSPIARHCPPTRPRSGPQHLRDLERRRRPIPYGRHGTRCLRSRSGDHRPLSDHGRRCASRQDAADDNSVPAHRVGPRRTAWATSRIRAPLLLAIRPRSPQGGRRLAKLWILNKIKLAERVECATLAWVDGFQQTGGRSSRSATSHPRSSKRRPMPSRIRLTPTNRLRHSRYDSHRD